MFNMMSMDLQRTDGDIRLLGKELDSIDIVKDGNKMGICPQANTIWDVMTVDQCIKFICEIKGIKKDQIAI